MSREMYLWSRTLLKYISRLQIWYKSGNVNSKNVTYYFETRVRHHICECCIRPQSLVWRAVDLDALHARLLV